MRECMGIFKKGIRNKIGNSTSVMLTLIYIVKVMTLNDHQRIMLIAHCLNKELLKLKWTIDFQ